MLDDIQDRTFAQATGATLRAYPPKRRLRGARLTGYLDRHSLAVVTSTRADGRPHSAPSSYLRRETTFWLPTMAGAVRVHNVQRTPWLVLVVMEGEGSAHAAAIVEGTAEVIAPPDAPPEVAAAFAQAWVSNWLRLDAERILSYADEGIAD